MATISGIKVNKSEKGKTTHVIIDVRKHPQVIGLLKEAGLYPKTPLQIEAEGCLSVDALSDHLEKTIDDFYAKRDSSH